MMPEVKIPIVYSTSHEIFPKIVFGVLVILAVILFIQYVLKQSKANEPLFSLKGKQFFEKDYDKVKLFGSLILVFAFVFLLEPLGFIPAGILFMTLFNVLFTGRLGKKDILISLGIAIIETMTVWFIFGYLFEITLP